jgi:hypothetical protein
MKLLFFAFVTAHAATYWWLYKGMVRFFGTFTLVPEI